MAFPKGQNKLNTIRFSPFHLEHCRDSTGLTTPVNVFSRRVR